VKMSWFVWLGILTIGFLVFVIFKGVNLTFSTDVMIAFGFLIDAYVGGDQFAAAMATRKMPSGKKFTQNRTKLAFITFGVYALLIESLVLLMIAGEEGRTVQLPVMGFLFVFILELAILVGGEKLKTGFEGEGPMAFPSGIGPEDAS
jgi:hypothetical protein